MGWLGSRKVTGAVFVILCLAVFVLCRQTDGLMDIMTAYISSDGTIWPWGKTMDTIRYCTKYRDTIRYNTVPKRCAVCQQSKSNVAFSLTPCIMPYNTINGR